MKKLLSITLVCLFACIFSCDKGEKILKDNVQEIEEYLEANNLTAERTEDDLFYIIEVEGNGVFPETTDRVKVDYEGYFTNGQIFDSSYERGTPLTIELTSVIRGWRDGIPLFSEGGKGKLLIPSHLGYGEFDSNGIPGESVLIFDIELLEVN
jgi:FKBP-type peptidyl-prolyl cis-trans isomerase